MVAAAAAALRAHLSLDINNNIMVLWCVPLGACFLSARATLITLGLPTLKRSLLE